MDEEIKDSSCADSQELQTSETETKSEEKKDEQIQSQSLNNEKKIVEDGSFEAITKPSEIDQDLYKEILEKLDIAKKEDTQEKSLQPKPMQEKSYQEKSLDKIQVEKTISQDFDKIQKLVNSGLINSAQGQDLKKQVLKKAFDKLVQTEKIKRNFPMAKAEQQMMIPQANKNKVFEEFNKSNPDFFKSDGRKEVLNYLESDEITLGKDELSKISNIIRSVEKAAIDRYLKKMSHEKTLRDSNEIAKQRLTANAQKSAYCDKNLSRTFTREQIGKMSSAEFTKYEPFIMEQLKKGLIK